MNAEPELKDHEYRPDDDMVCWDCGEGVHRPWAETIDHHVDGWASNFDVLSPLDYEEKP